MLRGNITYDSDGKILFIEYKKTLFKLIHDDFPILRLFSGCVERNMLRICEHERGIFRMASPCLLHAVRRKKTIWNEYDGGKFKVFVHFVRH